VIKRSLKRVLPLREESFFRGMSDETIARMETYVHHREYEPHQIVFFSDDPCDYAYWVREGHVKVTRLSSEGREVAFRHVFPGDLFGEECMIGQPRRGTYAEAVSRTVLCIIRADDFRRVVRDEAEVAFEVAKRLCHRAKAMEDVWFETVFKPVRNRVASGLLRLLQRTGGGVVRATHQDIAGLIGATRETTTAVLHELQREGVLETGNRRVAIRDAAALERIAGSQG
jgi:CRP/FNR family transcriptional regulator, cyclic AMP receptor protein